MMKKRYLIPAVLIGAVSFYALYAKMPKNDVPEAVGKAVEARPLPPVSASAHPLLTEPQRSGMHAGSYNTDVSDYAGPLGKDSIAQHRSFGKIIGIPPNISFDDQGRLITVALNLGKVTL